MKVKKCLACMVLAASLLTVCIPEVPAQAAAPGAGSVAQPCKEEKKWYYRVCNGRIQHRLWSITYMKWLTEWEYI